MFPSVLIVYDKNLQIPEEIIKQYLQSWFFTQNYITEISYYENENSLVWLSRAKVFVTEYSHCGIYRAIDVFCLSNFIPVNKYTGKEDITDVIYIGNVSKKYDQIKNVHIMPNYDIINIGGQK